MQTKSHPHPPVKKKKQTVPMMELLAYNSTDSARALLKKHGAEDAHGYLDLQHKLSDLYAGAKDKLEIEKSFAEIHPHKDFILKHLSPPPVKTKVIIGEPLSALEGEKQPEIKQGLSSNDKFLISTVAIVGIVALVIYTKK